MAISFKQSLEKSSIQNTLLRSSTFAMPRTMSLDESTMDDESWSEYDTKYRTYTEYSDTSWSTVDEAKRIHIHASQMNFSQESNSQYIPFEMPRRYDGFDLKETMLWIHFVNSKGGDGYEEPVNVRYSDEHIRFAWLVDDRATAVSGNLAFELHATGRNSHGEKYEWVSQPNKELTVLPSLCGDRIFTPEFQPEMDFIVTDDGEGNVVLSVGVTGDDGLPDGEEMVF